MRNGVEGLAGGDWGKNEANAERQAVRYLGP